MVEKMKCIDISTEPVPADKVIKKMSKKIILEESLINEIAELYNTTNITVNDICKNFNLDFRIVNRALTSKNIKLGRKCVDMPEDEILNMYNLGFSIHKISITINEGYKNIKRVLKNNKIILRDGINKKIILDKSINNEIASLYEAGEFIHNIAKKYNYSPAFISKTLKANNVKLRTKKEFTLDEEQQVISDYNSEYALSYIKIKFKIDYRFIKNILLKHNIAPRVINKLQTENNIQKIIDLYEKNISISEIFRQLNISKKLIRNILLENNIIIKSSTATIFSDNQINKMISLYEQGLFIHKIADEFNCTSKVIYRIFKEHNIKIKEKYTNKIIVDEKLVLELYQKNISCNAIAKQLNCYNNNIKEILIKNNISIIPLRTKYINNPNLYTLYIDYISGISFFNLQNTHNISYQYIIKSINQYSIENNLNILDIKNKRRKALFKIKSDIDEKDPSKIQSKLLLKIHERFSSNFNSFVKLNKLSKNKSSFKLVGYTREQYIKYIENLFSSPENLTPGGKVWMNWNNQGIYNLKTWIDNDPSTWVWNLDHINPASSLRYGSFTDENFKKCWSLENLRPLLAKQNIIDGDRGFRRNKRLNNVIK